LLAVNIALLYSLFLPPGDFKFSFAYNGYEVRSATLCKEHLVPLEILLLELFHELSDLVERPVSEVWQRLKEVTFLLDRLVVHSLDELVVVRSIHLCEITIGQAADGGSSGVLADDG